MPYKDLEKRKAYHREYSRRWYQQRKAEREAARREAAKAQKRFLLHSNPSNPAALEEALAELMDHPLTPLETYYLQHLVKTHGLDEVWHAVAAVFAASGRVSLREIDAALGTPL
ncbi:hypothetical protein [Thermodesulfitimonas autotrophica]|uniref:hypothetical protein n=1 Tax=Thermodesulfitimonas autotrophica TaxID=1894989 RepID=UPI002FE2690E